MHHLLKYMGSIFKDLSSLSTHDQLNDNENKVLELPIYSSKWCIPTIYNTTLTNFLKVIIHYYSLDDESHFSG